jgi:hypothetical protein
MNLWGNNFSYTKQKFSLNQGYAKLYQETVHLIRDLLYNYDRIVTLFHIHYLMKMK